jgi:hypothetical protein
MQAPPQVVGDETIVQPATDPGEPPKVCSPKREIVARSGPRLTKETQALLQVRLRAATLMLLIGFGIFLARHAIGDIWGESISPVLLGFHVLVVLVLSLSAARLWHRRDMSIKQLRISELVTFGVPAAFFLILQHRVTMEDAARIFMPPPLPFLLLLIFTMEYLPGLSLEDLLERNGPLPAERVVHFLRQVCHGLHEAHEVGLIHRDVKPANIFAAQRGGLCDVVKLLDFGLVKPVRENASTSLSQEGGISGTPLFMSPEQARGLGDLDARSDIYSLGAVAYALLTGRPLSTARILST